MCKIISARKKRKQQEQTEDWRDAHDWWKAPVLQGPENDYGDYDYLIEEIPENRTEWLHNRDGYHCDDCGKYRRHVRRDIAYFRTMDGYDSLDYNTCWRCELARKLHLPIRRTGKSKKEVKSNGRNKGGE